MADKTRKLTHTTAELDEAVEMLLEVYTREEINGLLSGKVDKSPGKGLSANDFTDAEKQKLFGLENYDDAGIKSKAALNRGTLGYQRKNLLKVRSSFVGITSGVTTTQQSDGKLIVSGVNTAAYTNNIYSRTYDGYAISNGEALFIKGAETISNCRYMVGIITASGADNWLEIPHQGLVISGDTTIKTIYIQQNIIGKEIYAEIYPLVQLAKITDDTYEPYKPSVEERLAALEAAVIGGGT